MYEESPRHRSKPLECIVDVVMSTATLPPKPRIAIIGGGPSGLVLLLTLLKRGIPATLYEREADSHSRAQLGGMLDLEWDSGQRALRENGLEAEFIKHSRAGDAEETRVCGKDGVLVFHLKPERTISVDDSANLRDARPEIDRRILRELLLNAIPADSVKWGYSLVSVRPLGGGQHELTFANGHTTISDILVGADGAHSRIRPLLSSATPLYHGVTGPEISIPPDVAALPENSDINDAIGLGSMYASEGKKLFFTQRNGDGRIRAYVWHCAPLEWSLPSDPKAAKQVLLDMYKDWAPFVRKFIQICDENAIYTRPLLYLPVGHRWEHKPGVTIIGDAAHLMSPFAGAGANLAMVDGLELGLTLADAISQGLDADAREAAVAKWEETMSARAEKFADMAARNLEASTGPDAPHSMANAWRRAIELAAQSRAED
ncbi:FAD/NAD-P-binding domain-containing protein [Cubamyces sp. BRFM 1775]|nr:FAD/NAD-P-binding domain-containing protein [Cubamyces sp. BRFM 1775]